MSDLVTFNFSQVEPDTRTFYSRFSHFLEVTDPYYFFLASDQEIIDSVKDVQKYKQMAKDSPYGDIKITNQEKEKIIKGIKLMNANTNDVGELVFKPFRMCGFVPVNIPILCGILLSPPTMKYTIFF